MTGLQLELGYDPAEARRDALATERQAADDAIARAGEHADQEWLARARGAIRAVAATHPTLIADDIWSTGLPEPREARAIGNVIKWAAAEGLIASTADFIPSARPGSHCVPRRVWRSLIYEGDA